MTEKKRENWNALGLNKDKDGFITFNDQSPDVLPKEALRYAAHYGIYAMMTRSTARSKDMAMTADEKKDAIAGVWQWLNDGMPKSARAKLTPEEKAAKQKADTIAAMREAVKDGSPAEKKMVEQIIAKMK